MVKRILTDVDGVLLEWVGAIRDFLEHEKGYKLDPKKVEDGYFISEWINVTRDESARLVAEFHHSEAFKKLAPINRSQEALGELAADGWRFVAITACLNPHTICPQTTKNNRMENLSHLFGPIFDDVEMICVQTGCKSGALKRYDATWWVEDTVHFAMKGHEIGHKALLMNGPYYRMQPQDHNLPIFNDWTQILRHIRGSER